MASPHRKDDEMGPMPFSDASDTSSDTYYTPEGSQKKWRILIGSFVSFILCMIFASQYGFKPSATEQHDGNNQTEVKWADLRELSTFHEVEEPCGPRDEVANMTIWNEAVNKTASLIDDKFTIVLQTYRRPTQLNKTLYHLTSVEMPSLYEIVVVWNDQIIMPPKDYVGNNSVPVRFRVSEKNSLNQKLLPDPEYKTQGVLLSDDDWNYNYTDVDWAFQHWRRAGMHRLTGAFARCIEEDELGEPKYSICRGGVDKYQLVLTGLAFAHMSFLEYYWSEDPLMLTVRKYVDLKFNCEDIALNYVASMLTCEGPLQVIGLRKLDHQAARVGISSKPGHMGRRTSCLKEFNDYFNYNPLHEVNTWLRRGVSPVG
ncbi:hypothetical protein F53441_6512 [Fusarium austroafricanum]|uniref:Glycosyl transferase 64 domain-containing protein n=1 Tax=Fusarium austroafricanum TaxID=2364996 RepID=A0A8H4KJI6_9HYPO|nr:hypothetical protein F53441_6512 [Fusarium austroafricanum]